MDIPFTELIYNAAGTICLALVIVLGTGAAAGAERRE